MDDKDVIIKRLTLQVEKLQKQVAQLTDQIKTLSAENLELRERIAPLEKNSATGSKPPSSDRIHPQTINIMKKKKGKQDGRDIPSTFVHHFSPMSSMRRSSTNFRMKK